MKGLIIKDLYNFKKTSKNFIFVIAIFALSAFVNKNPITMSSLLFFLSFMLPVNSYAFDDHFKWNKFANTLPISSKDIVLGKFVLGLIFSVVATIISAIIALVFFPDHKFSEFCLSVCAFSSLGITFMSIILPIFIKYGVEKARIIIFAFAALPVIVSLAIKKLLNNFDPTVFIKYKDLIYFTPLIGIIIAIISIVVCIKLMDNKEY